MVGSNSPFWACVLQKIASAPKYLCAIIWRSCCDLPTITLSQNLQLALIAVNFSTRQFDKWLRRLTLLASMVAVYGRPNNQLAAMQK